MGSVFIEFVFDVSPMKMKCTLSAHFNLVFEFPPMPIIVSFLFWYLILGHLMRIRSVCWGGRRIPDCLEGWEEAGSGGSAKPNIKTNSTLNRG